VARHIPEESRRQQFIEQARGAGHAPAGSPLASGATPVPRPATAPAAVPADPLTEEFRTQVALVATRKMGPIARVMVRRAADAAGGSRARFVQLLLEALPEADRAALQVEIDKLA